jgi:hypothetical protein
LGFSVSDKVYSVQEVKAILAKHLQEKIDQAAKHIEDLKKRELSKASLLEDSHMEPGLHEAAGPGIPEHTEPGTHEKFQLTPPAQPGSEAPAPIGSSVQQPAGDVDPCVMCGQPDVPGSCVCMGMMKREGGAPTKAATPTKAPKADGDPTFDGTWNVFHQAPHGVYHSTGDLSRNKAGLISLNYTSTKSKKTQHLGNYPDKHQAEAARLHHHDKVAAGIVKDEMDMGGSMDAQTGDMDKSDACVDCGMMKGECSHMAKAQRHVSAAAPGEKTEHEGTCEYCKKRPALKGTGGMCQTCYNKEMAPPKDTKHVDMSKTAVTESAVKGSKLPEECKEIAKDEVPMAKPPSGKVPGQGAIPTSKPGMAKAAMPMAPKAGKAMAQQHALADASKQAKTVNLQANGKDAATALTHPGDATRANTHQAALGGAFTPKGPVNSGLELARPPKLAPPPPNMRPKAAGPFGKSEDLGNCAMCGKAEHLGSC